MIAPCVCRRTKLLQARNLSAMRTDFPQFDPGRGDVEQERHVRAEDGELGGGALLLSTNDTRRIAEKMDDDAAEAKDQNAQERLQKIGEQWL